MMDAVDQFEIGHHGVYPVAFDRRFHCGIHLNPGEQHEPVRAIADGEVVAYRVCKHALSDGAKDPATGQPLLNSNAGFVLLRHKTDTGDGRTIVYYSLYMHLLDMTNQEHFAPQPNDPPETGSAIALPKWLLDTAGGKDGVVQPGGTKRVYRKDMLGYVGQHQGVAHLHFEIFMADADFTAWFDQDGHKVQLGEKSPVQPTSSDYWGHTYFVIHGPKDFVSQPVGTGDTWFPRLPGGAIGEHDTLYVQAWFNTGRRYTQAWIDRGNSGKVALLTPDPVSDPYDNETRQYEYDLYQRSMALYPTCPSDGYELLRFGRILSDHPSLTGVARATWVAVPFDENGTQGYVNIAADTIIKLSDADFPFFKDWQKVDEENTPFNHGGLCGYDELCRLIGVADPQAASGMIQPLEYDKNNNSTNQQLAGYVRNADGVREKLRGLVCKARSEWDASNNDARYQELNDPDGFFGKQKDANPDGYKKFIDFLGKFQFLDQTPLAEQKLWFFHPLAFVRHFRKCSWLSKREMLQLIPAYVIRKPGSHNSNHQAVWEQPGLGFASPFLDQYGSNLNNSMRKFKLDTPVRQACFIANATQETGWFHYLREGNRSDSATDLHNGWFGRGFLQLTNAQGNMGGGSNNYYRYFKFLGRSPSMPPGALELQWRNEIGRDDFHASHNAGAYWVWPGKSMPSETYPLRPKVDSASKYADAIGINERRTIRTNAGIKVWYYNQSFANCAASVNYPGATEQNPPNMNGLVDRSTSFTNALMVLTDVAIFKGSNNENLTWPENFSRRKVP